MTFRRRILLLIGGALGDLTVKLYEVLSSVLLKDFSQLEKGDLVHAARPGRVALANELASPSDEVAYPAA